MASLNYLNHHTQCCKFINLLSDHLSVNCGVPQGLTLGPSLFICYVNVLVNYIPVTRVSLDTDDTVCYYTSSNSSFLNKVMNNACNSFYKGCGLNCLTLNIGKCKAMVISGSMLKKIKKLKRGINIRINHENLEIVNKYKYLGVILNESLNFQSCIKMLKQKIKQRAYLLKKFRNVVGKNESLTIYKSSILPYKCGSRRFILQC